MSPLSTLTAAPESTSTRHGIVATCACTRLIGSVISSAAIRGSVLRLTGRVPARRPPRHCCVERAGSLLRAERHALAKCPTRQHLLHCCPHAGQLPLGCNKLHLPHTVSRVGGRNERGGADCVLFDCRT
jgi:hypothetical protein